jgi:hypothetical protein
MLYPSLLKSELQSKLDEFVSFDKAMSRDALDYARSLRRLGTTWRSHSSDADVSSAPHIDERDQNSTPGAAPTGELAAGGSIIAPFRGTWQSHEEARRWAFEVLLDRVTFAADGSQLLPGRDISLPVAAVQVAWFENLHSADGRYVKQAQFEIVPPAALFERDGRINPETVVTYHRTRLEIEKLCDFMISKRGWRERGERTPLAFFDGSLTYLISFPLPKARIQDHYADEILKLLRVSAESEVPIVGFVDHSYARELVKMIDVKEERDSSTQRYPYNSQILRAAPAGEQALLPSWGDRTILFSFIPTAAASRFADEKGNSLFGFCYLQTTAESLPVRLEIPMWVYEAGLLDEVVDTVRAECVVGLGYPYAIETADEAAVISVRDRDLFLQAVQDFAETNRLAFRVSRKSTSKTRRR